MIFSWRLAEPVEGSVGRPLNKSNHTFVIAAFQLKKKNTTEIIEKEQ